MRDADRLERMADRAASEMFARIMRGESFGVDELRELLNALVEKAYALGVAAGIVRS